MTDRRQFCRTSLRLALAAAMAAPALLAASGCGGAPPPGATPNPEMNVDESGAPPDGKGKKKKG